MTIGGISAITNGEGASLSAKISSEKAEETKEDIADDLPYEITDDEPSVVEEEHKATQISFFDL